MRSEIKVAHLPLFGDLSVYLITSSRAFKLCLKINESYFAKLLIGKQSRLPDQSHLYVKEWKGGFVPLIFFGGLKFMHTQKHCIQMG